MAALNMRIKQLREKSKLTQGDIADLLNMPRTTYASWEKDTEPSIADFNKLAAIFKLSLQAFIQYLTEENNNLLHEPEIAYAININEVADIRKNLVSCLKQLDFLQSIITEKNKTIEQKDTIIIQLQSLYKHSNNNIQK